MAQHEHGHPAPRGTNRLKIALGLILGILVLEVIGSILSNSLSLLSDAGHMLVDALGLGLSLFALTVAGRPATLSRTFGYLRLEIVAALVNGATLAVLAAYIFYEAYQRFRNPPGVEASVMLVFATIGLVANVAGIFLLRGISHSNLNLRAAFWHVLGDTLSSVGVVAAAIIIALTGQTIADPIIAVVIGFIILWGSFRLVRESLNILLEAVPSGIRTEKVIEAIKTVPGVEDIHDIHIWTITSGVTALSAHIIIADQLVSASSTVIQEINEKLARLFSITHTTLQFECEKCLACPIGYICQIHRPEE